MCWIIAVLVARKVVVSIVACLVLGARLWCRSGLLMGKMVLHIIWSVLLLSVGCLSDGWIMNYCWLVPCVLGLIMLSP